MIGENAKGNALLCVAWGETERPCAALIYSEKQLRAWLVSEVREDPEENDQFVEELREHDWHDEGEHEVRLKRANVELVEVFAEIEPKGAES